MPKIVNGFEIFERGEMPAARPAGPRRGARRKYPWWETEKGGGFGFAPEVIEQSARVQASNMSRQTGYEFKVYYDAEGALWCMRVDGVPRSEWPDQGQPKGEKYKPVAPVEPGATPPAVRLIDDGQHNDFHDDTGGIPTTFGEDAKIGPQSSRIDVPEFEPSGDEEWDARARGGVDKGIPEI